VCPRSCSGSTADRVISAADPRRTAKAYAADLHIFDGMGHDLMLDSGWPQVADHIQRWLVQGAGFSNRATASAS
jgi:pimeloyl-ACP methyl ester carboxylesterase